jgi:hypothetical protein
MMVKLLVYRDATGAFGSRKIECRLHDDLAFRMLGSGNLSKRSPRSRSLGALGGPADRIEDSPWHKFGTTCGRAPEHVARGDCNPLIFLKFLVGPA